MNLITQTKETFRMGGDSIGYVPYDDLHKPYSIIMQAF